ncbi:hypothetical protein MFLAVUS_008748 [Mucor flavus]|uniref:Uncharacterized protein n=1 Tax=Mucor flavus TaxID=439312 RepID=A0ABP9Z7Z2_9FUNG
MPASTSERGQKSVLNQADRFQFRASVVVSIYWYFSRSIDCNDIIDMQWQKQTPSTGDVKWDDVAFLVKNKLVVPLLVELSGGIDRNSSTEKAQGDEEKMIRKLIKLLKIKKAEGLDLPHMISW